MSRLHGAVLRLLSAVILRVLCATPFFTHNRHHCCPLIHLAPEASATMRINLYDQVQALLSVEPLDRLRAYLSQAVLPPMKLSPKAPQLPPPGHHSHKNTLSVVPQQYRLLEKMYVIENADFWYNLRTSARLYMHIHLRHVDALSQPWIDMSLRISLRCEMRRTSKTSRFPVHLAFSWLPIPRRSPRTLDST